MLRLRTLLALLALARIAGAADDFAGKPVLVVLDFDSAWDEGKTGGGSTDVADISWKTPTMEFRTTSLVLGAPGHSWPCDGSRG